MESYKNLILKRELIDQNIKNFAEQHSFSIREITEVPGKKIKRVRIGKAGINDATLDLYLIKDGTTTIHYKTGKNHQLGELLADFLRNTIESNELTSINCSIKGISVSEIDIVLDELEKSTDENGAIEFRTEKDQRDTRNIIKIQSIIHDDKITLIHYPTTNLLQIQGKTLFTYRKITYLLSALLDLSGLQQVLRMTEEDAALIVKKEDAQNFLKSQLIDSYDKLPRIIRNMLVSGCCIKLASPQLPEYSMLLYPELRSLEGSLKSILGEYGMNTGEKHGIGGFFSFNQDIASLNPDFHSLVNNETNTIKTLNTAYNFLRKHRHTLFHMNEWVDSSRTIDTLDKALSLSKDSYKIINDLYKLEVN